MEASFSGPGVDFGPGAVDASPCVDPGASDTSVMKNRSPEKRPDLSKSPPMTISFSIDSILQDADNSVPDPHQPDGAQLAPSADTVGPSRIDNKSDFPPLSFFYRDKLHGSEKPPTSSSEAGHTADALISSWTMSQTSPLIYREWAYSSVPITPAICRNLTASY